MTETTDEVVEARESVDPDAVDPLAPPAPITSFSTPTAVNDRVLYENSVNDEARAFGRNAELAYIDAKVNGRDIEIVVSGNDADDEDSDLIAPDTALAAALDAGLKPYAEWTNAELSDECRNRDLPVSGTKDELIERLEASDAADVAEATGDSTDDTE